MTTTTMSTSLAFIRILPAYTHYSNGPLSVPRICKPLSSSFSLCSAPLTRTFVCCGSVPGKEAPEGNLRKGGAEVRYDDLHVPVLLEHVLECFKDHSINVFVDGTLGAGGHADALLAKYDIKKYIGIDRDPHALEIASRRLEKYGDRVSLHYSRFGSIDTILHSLGIENGQVDGCLLDVGVSSMQIDDPNRGFSFSKDGPLDMRMDPISSALTAKEIVNSWSEEDIGSILRDYGEEKGWRKMASSIVRARATVGKIETTVQLARIIAGSSWRPMGRSKVHPATQAFQALRICVNQELSELYSAVSIMTRFLTPGKGRMAVITFHSLEDRIVKQSFKEKSKVKGGVRILHKKPLEAYESEVDQNPRSRSAKLRVIERMYENELPKTKKNKYKPDDSFEDEDESQ